MTLDAAAILDQKRSPGLIENPCRDALVELAGLVPADQAIVELGSFMGRSTGHLVLGAQRGNGAHVHAVDPWEDAEPLPEDYLQHSESVAQYAQTETRQAFEKHMAEVGATGLFTAHQATAVQAAEAWDGPKVGLLFHDSLHRLEDVRDDLKAWLPHLAKQAVIVLHDVGDPDFAVEAGAKAALGRRKAWDWDAREVHLWPKNPQKRGYMILRSV